MTYFWYVSNVRGGNKKERSPQRKFFHDNINDLLIHSSAYVTPGTGTVETNLRVGGGKHGN